MKKIWPISAQHATWKSDHLLFFASKDIAQDVMKWDGFFPFKDNLVFELQTVFRKPLSKLPITLALKLEILFFSKKSVEKFQAKFWRFFFSIFWIFFISQIIPYFLAKKSHTLCLKNDHSLWKVRKYPKTFFNFLLK